MSISKNKISAIIACYRDAQAIPIMHERLVKTFKKIGCDYEIIFVNDGSPDNTTEVLEKIVAKDTKTIGVCHSRNFSSQMAFTSGMDIATGDGIVFLDGDLQDPPEVISDFYKKWQEGFDVIYGVRVKREAPVLMQFLYKIFYRLFHKLSYIRMPLDAGDFGLIDKKVYSVLKVFPERDRFLRGLRAWVGFRQVGVEYFRPERMFGKTTNNFLKNLTWASKGIFSFSFVPLQILSLVSAFIFITSAFFLVLQIIVKIIAPQLSPVGYTSMMSVILFLGSIQMLGISILGEYIGKIFEEVKQRPKYVVDRILRYQDIKKVKKMGFKTRK